jgi:hypothetical protein
MKYITNASAIIIILESGEKVRVEKTDPKYASIVKVFELPKDEQEQAVLDIVNPARKLNDKGFVVAGDDVSYEGEKLPKALATKIKSIIRDGLPIEHFENFWKNLKDNPSAQSIAELTDFLSYKELPITEDGCFVAYKGVRDDYYSASGNKETKVIKGKVDEHGHIYNGVGEVIEVSRSHVDDDRNKHCSFGLHCGSFDYGSTFANKTVLVKVNPKDVVSVPTDCNFQKCRVCKYEVVAEFTHEIKTSVVDEKGQDVLEVDKTDEKNSSELQAYTKKVQTYLENKKDAGVDQVTIRQVQNSVSPSYITKEVAFNILQDLWYDWEYDDEIGMEVVYL